LHTEINHADEQQGATRTADREPGAHRDEGAIIPGLADALLIQRLQATAGNAAVAQLLSRRRHGPTAQRVADPGVQAALREQVATQVAEAAPKSEGDAPAAGTAGPKATGEVNPAELSKKKAELGSRIPAPEEASKQAPAVEQAAAAAKQEAAKPADPIVKGHDHAPPKREAPGTGAQSAAAEASALASQAFALAAAPEVPSPPEAAAAVEPIVPVDAGGEPLPPVPVLDAGAAGLTQRIQFLRDAGHRLRQGAARETSTAHRIRGTIKAAEGKIAQSESGVATLQSATAYRREVSGQAKSALTVSEQKAATVAEQAPTIAAKGQEGGQKSGPMAGEAKHLAEQNASKQPDDADAASKSRDQGQKLNKVGSDLGTMDSAISQTTARAGTLVQDAAQAKAKNIETKGKISATEASLSQTEARATEMAGQNAAARGQLAALAGGPNEMIGGARHLDEQGQALIQSSSQLEADLHRARQSFTAGLQSVPARQQVPQSPPPLAGEDRVGVVQRAGYEDRKNLNLAGTATQELPSWLTGAEEPSQDARQKAQQQEAQRHKDELDEINARAGGNFHNLDEADKAGIALRLTGRHLLGSVGATSFPNFVGGIARAFVDPRVALMGVIAGLSMTLSGVANLLSAEQWEKDPVGNLLKSAADIATGVTIVLGSIAGLAVAIIVVLTALTILSFGALGPIAAMVIPFCATVAATVGPWAITAAEIALVLQGLVLIKNLIDASTAQTAEELETKSDQMTEDATQAGQMAMQIGMAKAMTAVGEHFGGGAGKGVVGEGEPATVTEPVAATAEAPPIAEAPGTPAEPATATPVAEPAVAEPPGAHTELSQPGGLSATEGTQLAKRNRGGLPADVEGPVEPGATSHPLEKHGPGPDLTTDPEIAQVSEGPTPTELEGRVTSGKVKTSTQFLDRAQMETSIAKTIQANEAKINEWKASNPPEGVTKSFDYDPKMGNLGRGFERVPGPKGQPITARPVAGPLEGVRVVLISNGRRGYIIHTAHPIPVTQIRP